MCDAAGISSLTLNSLVHTYQIWTIVWKFCLRTFAAQVSIQKFWGINPHPGSSPQTVPNESLYVSTQGSLALRWDNPEICDFSGSP